MTRMPMSKLVQAKLTKAAHALNTADPMDYIGPLVHETFSLPVDDSSYGDNALAPKAVPLETSYSEAEPNGLRFTVEPLGPLASPQTRMREATRQMRALVHPLFGRDALRWFDGVSEEWRGSTPRSNMGFGAWFGSAFDRDGLYASKVYYELDPNRLDVLPKGLEQLSRLAVEVIPGLKPLFTTITARSSHGRQRVTFYHDGDLRVGDLKILFDRLQLGHQLPSLMRVVGLVLGGRFDLPDGTVLIGLCDTPQGPEFKLEILLGMLDDLPHGFLELLKMGLLERPQHLQALDRWINAFTPDESDIPGDFSVLSIRVTPRQSARISIYLRPLSFMLPEDDFRLEGAKEVSLG